MTPKSLYPISSLVEYDKDFKRRKPMKYLKANIYHLIAVFSIFIIQFSILNTQDTWIRTYQPFGDVYYYPEDIVVCQDSGYAVNGYYFYSDEWDEEQWGFLMKTDSEGNLLWVHPDTVDFMSENKSLAFVETSDGGFISGCSSGVLIKRDSDGNREWVIDSDFGINSMCNTTDGNIILGGAQNLNIGLRKIDEEGNTIWTQVFPIDDDYSICKSIIQTQDGGYTLTGYLDYENRQVADIIAMKTDDNGDSLWTRTFDGYGFWDTGKSVTEDSNGNIMVAGEILNPNTTGFLWFLDNEGNTIWTEEVNGSIGYSHYSILSISDNSFTAICQTFTGAKLYNYDNNYNLSWNNTLTGWSGRGDKPIRSIQNNFYVCCIEQVGGLYENNLGIAKTDSVGQVTSINNEIIFPTDLNLSNYPNPFNTNTTIQYELPLNINEVSISIYNIKGQFIKRFTNIGKQKSVLWNGTDQKNKPVSSGFYLYRIDSDDVISITKKMILTK